MFLDMKKLIILFTLLIFFGCSEDDSTNEEPQTQDPNATIADNVVVILEDNSELISSESELSTGIYKFQFTQSVPEIEVNDVIVGDEGLGFIRRVSSVDINDNTITVQTTQGTMEDVFGNVSFGLSTNLSGLNRMSAPVSERVNYEYFADGVSRNSNSFEYSFNDVSIFETANVNFKISQGSLTYNPDFMFDFDYSFFSIDRFEFGTGDSQFNGDATFALTINNGISIPIQEKTLYENSKSFVTLVSGVPVVTTVFFKLKAKFEISAENSFTYSKRVQSINTISLGAVYENGSWSPAGNIDSDFIQHPIDLDNNYNTLTETVALVPEVTIAFNGINGPFIEPSISGNFAINASNISDDWDAFLNAKSEIKFGASIGVLGIDLVNLTLASYDIFELPIWNAPDNVEIDETTNNQTGNQGEQLAEPIRVRVLDNSGIFYLKDVPVYFNVTSGSGTISSETVMTDDNGYAEVNWTLGDSAEPQTVEATVKKADGSNIPNTPKVFNATVDDSTITLNGDLDFGNIQINTTATRTLSITNNSASESVLVSSINLPNGFSTDWTEGTINPSTTQNILITFSPTETQTYSGTLVVNNNSDSINNSLPIQGNGIFECSGTEYSYCYGDNDDTVLTYTGYGVYFNSGSVEDPYDEIIVYDGPNTSSLVLYSGTFNNGDLTGLFLQGNSGNITVTFDADGSISCQSGNTCCASGINFTICD